MDTTTENTPNNEQDGLKIFSIPTPEDSPIKMMTRTERQLRKEVSYLKEMLATVSLTARTAIEGLEAMDQILTQVNMQNQLGIGILASKLQIPKAEFDTLMTKAIQEIQLNKQKE